MKFVLVVYVSGLCTVYEGTGLYVRVQITYPCKRLLGRSAFVGRDVGCNLSVWRGDVTPSRSCQLRGGGVRVMRLSDEPTELHRLGGVRG